MSPLSKFKEFKESIHEDLSVRRVRRLGKVRTWVGLRRRQSGEEKNFTNKIGTYLIANVELQKSIIDL